MILIGNQMIYSRSLDNKDSEIHSTFEDWIVQIPASTGQKNVQIPYPIAEFVCQGTLSAPVVFYEACV